MKHPDEVRRSVSISYARAVEAPAARNPQACCAGPSLGDIAATLAGYSREALAGLPADAVANSFGCGNPVALAEIREGDTILDLGSGAGIDLVLAAKLAGPGGRVIGVDMTPAMIERARRNAAAAGLVNVEVRQGIIEDLPVEADSVDLVISNCVINLSPEKERVFEGIHRVLKPGGRFSISDIVAEGLPESVRDDGALLSACISGAISEEAYLAGLQQAGMVDMSVRDRLVYDRGQLSALLGPDQACGCGCGPAGMTKEQVIALAEALAGKVASIRVAGRKPGETRPLGAERRG